VSIFVESVKLSPHFNKINNYLKYHQNSNPNINKILTLPKSIFQNFFYGQFIYFLHLWKSKKKLRH